MTCPFCAIIADPSTAHVVLDDDVCVAFLDRTPLFLGHVLLIPRTHVVTLPDLDATEVGPFFERVQRVARAMPAAMKAQGTFVAANNVVSQSIAHFHVHVVPRTKGDGLRGFFWPRTKYPSDDCMKEVAATLRSAVSKN